MTPISKIILLLSVSAFAINAAVIPREEIKSNVIKLLEASPNSTNIPDLSIQIVEPTITDVRGDVEDITDLAVDVIVEEKQLFRVASISTSDITTTDTLLFSVTLGSFLASKANKDPNTLNWTDDGCSYSPDFPSGFNFLHSCQRHDFGYRNFKEQNRFTDENRLKIDNKFKSDLYNECNKYSGLKDNICRGIADFYYEAVRTFGGL